MESFQTMRYCFFVHDVTTAQHSIDIRKRKLIPVASSYRWREGKPICLKDFSTHLEEKMTGAFLREG
ncbi:hypothetical protein ACQP3J_33120, partial [Escherichia coli]